MPKNEPLCRAYLFFLSVLVVLVGHLYETPFDGLVHYDIFLSEANLKVHSLQKHRHHAIHLKLYMSFDQIYRPHVIPS